MTTNNLSLNDTIYFHGSRINDITQLIIQPNNHCAFGPAIYLSEEESTAAYYTREGGAMYTVKVAGNEAFTINLDLSYAEQTPEAKRAIINSLDAMSAKRTVTRSKNIREIIHWDSTRAGELNTALSHNGIWLVYGHLSGMEYSGSQDKGVHYAVLNEAHAKIIESVAW